MLKIIGSQITNNGSATFNDFQRMVFTRDLGISRSDCHHLTANQHQTGVDLYILCQTMGGVGWGVKRRDDLSHL